MAEITWIKLKTDMFENAKIRLIEALPESDTIIIIWIKLLVAAGKKNCGGYIMLTDTLAMNEEEMATIFNRPLNTIRLALKTFERYEMIEMKEGVVYIKNWETHQNIDGMEKVKLQNKLRKQKQRERQKELTISHVTSRDSHATDIDKELDIDKEKKKKNSVTTQAIYIEIIDYLNSKVGTAYKPTSHATKTLINARMAEGYTVEDFKKVIDKKALSWLKDTNFSKYLRPGTLFGTKFEGYLNEKVRGYGEDKSQVSEKYRDGINF